MSVCSFSGILITVPLFLFTPIKNIKWHPPCLLLLKELISFTGPRQWHKSINPVFLSVIMSLGTELRLYLTLEWKVTELLLHKTTHNLPKNFVLSCNTKPRCRRVLRKCSVMCSNIREVVIKFIDIGRVGVEVDQLYG